MPANSLLHAPRARSVPRLLPALALALLAAGRAAAAEDITVADARGDVRIAERGSERAARAGQVLVLPSAVITGADGSADLRQGATAMGVGPNTRLEFPAPSNPSGERVIQPLGTAFYNVAGRASRLRVETPYLVAVIKGTQFNVVVEADVSTISLFEGSLEVRATEGDAVVQLAAGEIATRRRGEDGIRVIRMKDGAAAVVRGGGGQDGGDDGTAGDDAGVLPGGVDLDTDDGALALDPMDGSVTVDAGAELDGLSSAEVNLGAGAMLGGANLDAGVSVGADLDSGTVDATLDAAADLGVAEADLGVDAAADLAAGSVDAGADAGLDLGAAEVDAGLDVGADLTGGDAGLDLGLDLLDTEVGAEIDLGGGDAGSADGEDTGLIGTLRGRLGI